MSAVKHPLLTQMKLTIYKKRKTSNFKVVASDGSIIKYRNKYFTLCLTFPSIFNGMNDLRSTCLTLFDIRN